MPIRYSARQRMGWPRWSWPRTRLGRTNSPSDERAAAIRDDVAFFEAVRSPIAKIEGPDQLSDPGAEVDTAIRQLVSEATTH